MSFLFERLEIPDIVLIKPKAFADERGYFMETYRRTDFSNFGINLDFMQENVSLSKKGVTRGLHYQIDPASQGKLVSAIIPAANPSGIHIMFLFSSVSSCLTHFPKCGDPLRMSTATMKTLPVMALTNFPCDAGSI